MAPRLQSPATHAPVARMAPPDESSPGIARVDRWLFAVRLFKSRTDAAAAVAGGRVHVNGERVKPSRGLAPGDAVAFTRHGVEFDCVVLALPARRGPAAQATTCYEESEASRARRALQSERMKVAGAMAIRSDERPDKHGRRKLRQLRGRA